MDKKIDVPSFFANTETVWTSENFQKIILSTYVLAEKDRRDISVRSSELQDIRLSPQELVFSDADIFLEQLAYLIQDQLHGEDGPLLNDSSANSFFVQGKDGKFYSILVRWEQAQKLWRCGAYLQEELKLPSIRIFYPA